MSLCKCFLPKRSFLCGGAAFVKDVSWKTCAKMLIGTKFCGSSFFFSFGLTSVTDSDVIKDTQRLSDSHLHAYRTVLFGLPDCFWSLTLRFICFLCILLRGLLQR